MIAKSAIHLNGNILCAIDCETTGTIAGFHDLIQVCVLPLDSFLNPRKDILPFYMELVPKRKENFDPRASNVNRLRLSKIILEGMDPDRAADLFSEWVEKLNLPVNKRISPLAHNWPFDRSFLIDWLGYQMFDAIFDGRFRDTMTAALYCNDRADFNNEPCPYAKVGLGFIASKLEVEQYKAHDAMEDCLTTARIYKEMMKSLF